ncbi:hypothetical protein MORTIMER_282 [Erwinia phage vB_EamM_Mortimer]|uniref:Uncharacterized protein n=1 Tax=Erwinia phage vB_EamM_Mortimer TaxID=2060129 RepID=A0A2H5BL21_9CAUD|nr:hypothetical protein MORTIMER_282 [Erwinia phage vB_EamM_Mortimer]
MKPLFAMKFDTRDAGLGDQLDLLQSRVKAYSKHGTMIKDVAVTAWLVCSDNMPVAGDDPAYASIIHRYRYDIEQQCVVGGVSAMDALREIWSAYGPDSTLPPFSRIPGAVDMQFTLTVFTI